MQDGSADYRWLAPVNFALCKRYGSQLVVENLERFHPHFACLLLQLIWRADNLNG